MWWQFPTENHIVPSPKLMAFSEHPHNSDEESENYSGQKEFKQYLCVRSTIMILGTNFLVGNV